jgi:hypothetical protein
MMKSRLLIIIGIMMTVIGFTSSTLAQELPPCTSDRVACQNHPICENTMWDCPDNSNIFSTIVESEDIGGGSIDLDPDLSHSYAYDFVFSWNSIFMFVPMMLGIVGASLLIAHLILKRKKKPSRPYLILIIAGFLLYFGIPNAVQGLLLVFIIIFSPHLQTLEMIIGMLYLPIIGFSFIITGALLLTKPRSVRQLYRKYFE